MKGMIDVYIVLTGRRGHGKDTVADIAINKFDCAGKVALADWFKKALAKVFRINIAKFYDTTQKDEVFMQPIIVNDTHLRGLMRVLRDEYGYEDAVRISTSRWRGRKIDSIRDLMLWFGNEVIYKNCGSDFHNVATERLIANLPRKKPVNAIFISDARLYGQSKYFIDNYPHVYAIKIIRPNGSKDLHPVENAADQFPKDYFFRTIINDGTVADLDVKIKIILEEIKTDLAKKLKIPKVPKSKSELRRMTIMANTKEEKMDEEKVKKIFIKAEETKIETSESIATATDSDKFVCDYCGKICTSSSGLTLHTKKCKKTPKI